jgi:hypothetical protein
MALASSTDSIGIPGGQHRHPRRTASASSADSIGIIGGQHRHHRRTAACCPYGFFEVNNFLMP